jgi:hypothetical protein
MIVSRGLREGVIYMDKITKAYVGLGITVAVVLGMASAAFAVDPTPSEVATDVATAGVSADLPVIAAVATAVVVLAAAMFGARWAVGAIRRGGRI